MSQVPVLRTVATRKDYAHAAIAAWKAIHDGAEPTKEAVGVLYAQWMVETGGKYFWCWNIGNVKVTQGQVDAGVDWYDLPGTWEIINGIRVVLPEGHPGRRFRAYASLDDGMAEHLAFLRNKRYAPSWPFVVAGDPDGFARALKRQGYYTAGADDYARIMVAAHGQWMASTAFEDAADEPPDTEPAPIVEPDQPIVHPLHYGDDEPPPDAA